MSTAQAGVRPGQVYALLADGTTVEIRPAGPGDFGAVKAMHEALSPDNTYMRFFNLSRTTARAAAARRICQVPSPDQVALLALSDGEVVGCASYVTVGERVPGRQSGVAEIAFLAGNRGPGVDGTGDDRPEITRLDLSPVIAGPAGAIVMAARITVVPREPHDPFLRKLR